MKRFIFVGLLSLPVSILGQEIVTLTTPVTRSTRTTFQIERVIIDILAKSIMIQWKDNNGDGFSAIYPTPAPNGSLQPTGAQLLNTINNTNFTTTSLVKRIFQRLQTDGYIASGTISGTPE